jgi:glycosyltransferase involved in cell wall biosynthesis
MKVLHTTLSFSRGGRREAIAALARGLTACGVESHLCCIDQIGCEPDELAGLFAGHVALQRHGLLDFAALRRLRRYCREQHIDILHAHDAASEATCALALPLARSPLLMTFHRTLDFESASRGDRLRNALVGLRASAIVTASEERRRHYLAHNHVAARKLACIPLGIDLTRFRPDPQKRQALRQRLGLDDAQQVIGAAGHYGPEKGIDVVVDAFQRICRNAPANKLVLVVLGTGTREQEAAIRAGIDPQFSSRVHLVGFQQHSEDWFAGFDLMLHGARKEAFGLVLVEAMACGVPPVASAVGGIPDIVQDGVCGRLVPAADAQALAAAALELLAKPDTLARMSAAAVRRTHDEFNLETYARRYHALYRKMLGGTEGRSAKTVTIHE